MKLQKRPFPAAASLHTKLILALAVLIVVVLASLTYLLTERERENQLLELEARADRVAKLIARSLTLAVWNVDRREIDEQLAAFTSDPEIVHVVVTALGYGSIAEVGKQQGAALVDPIVRVQAMHFTNEVTGSQQIGEVRVVLTRALVEKAITARLRAELAQLAAILIALYAATYLMLRHMVSAPIHRLGAVVDRIALGDLGARCVVESGDELGRLALRVNTMAERLRESDARLREGQENLATTLNSIGDAVIATDAAGRVTRMNPVAERLTGWPLADALGRPLAEVFCIVSALTRLPAVDPVQQVMAHGQAVALANHTTLLARDGQEYQIADSAAPIRSDDGDIVGVVLVFSDVSEKYRAEAALRETNERFNDLVNSTDGIVWEADATSFTFTSISQNVERLLGYPAADWLQPGFWAGHIHPEDRDQAVQYCAACTGRIEDHDFEYRFITAAGRVVWLRDIVRVVSEQGQPRWLRGLMVDITPQKAAAAALLDSEQRWQFAVDGAGDGLWDWNLPANTVYFSPRWKALVGHTPDEISNHPDEWSTRVHPEDLPRVMADVQRHLDGASPAYTNEHRFRCKDGQWKWILGRGLVVERDGAGKALRMIGTIQDLTARKQAELALQASLHDKEALLREVHHRVKNNLQVVSSLLRLEAGRSGHAPTQAVLAEMQGRIRSMALLHESIYRSGTFAAIDLGAYLRQVATQALRSLQTAGASAQIRLRLNLGSVQVGLDQATPSGLLLTELVSNALKHAFPAGAAGEVAIELQPVPGAAADQWCLRVSDDGVGLPADFAARQQGSLGLQLVASLAAQMGASLVVGAAGDGVVFSVTFAVTAPTQLSTSHP